MFISPCDFGSFRLKSADSKALEHDCRVDMVQQGCSTCGGQGAERVKEWPPSISFQDTPL